MARMRGGRTRSAAVTAALVAAALLSQALPAVAQWGGSYGAQSCRYVGARLVCSNPNLPGGAAGGHAYEQWRNGSPALGSSNSPDAYQFPQYLGGHNSWYGFGR